MIEAKRSWWRLVFFCRIMRNGIWLGRGDDETKNREYMTGPQDLISKDKDIPTGSYDSE
jgi:hypothetical protein